MPKARSAAHRRIRPAAFRARLSAALFDLRASEYREWQRMAEALKSAAKAVADAWAQRRQERVESGLFDLADFADEPLVAMLLAGLALENLAKGLVIRREGLSGRGLGSLDKHETLSYLTRAKVRLSNSERKLVRRLEAYVLWAGRYPVPKNRAVDMSSGIGLGLPELEAFFELYRRLLTAADQPGTGPGKGGS
jgi:hypothetical protein